MFLVEIPLRTHFGRSKMVAVRLIMVVIVLKDCARDGWYIVTGSWGTVPRCGHLTVPRPTSTKLIIIVVVNNLTATFEARFYANKTNKTFPEEDVTSTRTEEWRLVPFYNVAAFSTVPLLLIC